MVATQPSTFERLEQDNQEYSSPTGMIIIYYCFYLYNYKINHNSKNSINLYTRI